MKPEKSLHEHAITIVNRGFIGILLIIFYKYFPHPVLSLGLFSVGIGLLVNAILYSRKHYRCPHCGAALPLKGSSHPAFCMDCGKKLNGDSDT